MKAFLSSYCNNNFYVCRNDEHIEIRDNDFFIKSVLGDCYYFQNELIHELKPISPSKVMF